jgi:hypothetical protein
MQGAATGATGVGANQKKAGIPHPEDHTHNRVKEDQTQDRSDRKRATTTTPPQANTQKASKKLLVLPRSLTHNGTPTKPCCVYGPSLQFTGTKREACTSPTPIQHRVHDHAPKHTHKNQPKHTERGHRPDKADPRPSPNKKYDSLYTKPCAVPYLHLQVKYSTVQTFRCFAYMVCCNYTQERGG